MSSHHIAVRIHSPRQVGSKFDGQGADSAVSTCTSVQLLERAASRSGTVLCLQLQTPELRDPVGPNHHRLAKNREAMSFERRGDGRGGQELIGPADRIAAVDANDRAVAPNEHSVAVVLHFVNPTAARGRAVTSDRLGRHDEPPRVPK
jgi:hypothetical protein